MTQDQPSIPAPERIEASRLRVAGAVVTFAAIFSFSVVAMTSLLPSPAAAYLKLSFIIAWAILVSGANVYYKHFSSSRYDFAAWLVLCVSFNSVYSLTQSNVNSAVAYPLGFDGTGAFLALALMFSLANIASLITRKTLLGSFKIWSARGPL